MSTLPTRQEVTQKLAQVFSPEQVAVLAEVLDAFREEIEQATESAQAPPPREAQLDRFTERARRVLTLAQEEAERLKHDHLGASADRADPRRERSRRARAPHLECVAGPGAGAG
ncbi:MAG TPA: hypothetical protein VJG32_08550 [Anaerolineae bacterium]|nr:hypothetical protein [Anaerolineae bacterium]